MTTETLTTTAAPVPRLSPQRRLAVRVGNYALGANAALLFGFLYLPVLILIVFSFNNTRSVAIFTGLSLEWYGKLFQNDELLLAARSSLIIALISTLASTAIGTLTALALDRYRFRGRTAFDANLYLPIVIPEIVMGISLLLFFNQALFPLIETMTGLRFSTGLVTITLSHIAFSIPFVYIIVRARLADFNRTLEEAAQDLGADEWRTFQRVTLPLLMPGIIGGALLAFTLSLDDYLITAFTKGVGSNTMPLYIYSVVRKGVTPEINALSTALLIGSMALVGLSLTAQSGGPTLTRGMGLGAVIGAIGFALLRALGVLTAGAAVWNLGWLVLLTLGVWIGRVAPTWLVDLRESNAAGRWLAWFSLALAGLAAFVSLGLLFA